MLRSLAIVPVLAAAVLLFGCATPFGPPSNEGLPDRTTHANDSYFGVIDAIRSASPDGGAAGEKATIHSIRIRYDESAKGYTMNWDIIEGDWKQLKGLVKQKWGRLTDDHLDTVAGKRDQLAGKLQEAYGITADQAEVQVKAFEQTHKDHQPNIAA